MGIDIIALLKECPNITVTVQLADLVSANRTLLDDVQEVLESSAKAKNPSGEIITREKAMEILGVSGPTLWRWKKTGYLNVASHVGKKDMYRLSDVMNILEGKEDGTEL